MAGPAIGTLGSVGLVSGTQITAIGEMTEFNWTGIERASIDVSTLGAESATATGSFGGMDFLPGQLVNPGEITFTLLDPAYITNIDGAVITNFGCQLGDGSIFSGSAFMTGSSIANPLEDRVTMEVTMKCTGTWQGTLSTQVL